MFGRRSVQAFTAGWIFLVALPAQEPVAMRNLEFETVKLSYIRADRAVAILKSMGYVVIEFEAGRDLPSGERSYTPKSSERVDLTSIKPRDLPIVVLMPETDDVTLVKEDKSSGGGRDEKLGMDLSGVVMNLATDGEPMQRLLVGYLPGKRETIAPVLDLVRNKLDLPAKQILIEALVLELDSDKLDELGVDFNASGSGFTMTSPAPDPETGETNPFTIVFDRTILGNAGLFQANVEALVSTQAAEILSKPSVLVLDGRQARIQIGQQIPIVKMTDTQISSTRSVDYIPVGIVLNMRPRINEDNTRVTVQVETIISEIEERIGATGDDVSAAPLINNRRVQSFVRVANNTPFIIGGLIAKKVSKGEAGIPLLKDLPLVGRLFSMSTKRDIRKEVIVVITPHIVEETESNFSRVIPQDSDLFNTFDSQLFPNSYRVQHADVFDLTFIYESPIYKKVVAAVEDSARKDKMLFITEPYKSVLDKKVFGEEILVQRMLYEVIENMEYYKYINPDKVNFFRNEEESLEGFRVEATAPYIRNTLGERGKQYLQLEYSQRNEASLHKPFVRPTAEVKYLKTEPGKHYKQLLREKNKRNPEGKFASYSIILSEESHERRLYELLVMKKVMELNPDLRFQLDYFQPGIEILFPSPELLESDTHIVDFEVARRFYEVNDYYAAFEEAFNAQVKNLGNMIQ